MNALRALLGLALAIVLHIVLQQFAPWLGRFADPFLVWVTVQALSGNATRGMLSGLAAGWCEDGLVGETLFGLNGAAGTVVGFCVALSARQIVTGSQAVLGLLFVVASATNELVLLGLQTLLTASAIESDPLGLVFRGLGNGVLGLLVLSAMQRVSAWSKAAHRSRGRKVRLG